MTKITKPITTFAELAEAILKDFTPEQRNANLTIRVRNDNDTVGECSTTDIPIWTFHSSKNNKVNQQTIN